MSHLQGTNYVGSMVVFEDALPVKSDYRHFNVSEVLGNDDVGAMEEVVRRRLGALGRAARARTKFRRADLIIIDGGLPQLHAAEKAAAIAGARGPGGVRRAGQARGAAVPARHEPRPIALERGSRGALPRPARPRRGPPLRHHLSPLQARPLDGRLVARGRRGPRTGASRAAPRRTSARSSALRQRDARASSTRPRLAAQATSRRGSTIIYKRRRRRGPRRVATMSEVLLVTGMSGAGRSTVSAALEDLGWFVIDNLPARARRCASASSPRPARTTYAGVAFIVGRSGGVEPERAAWRCERELRERHDEREDPLPRRAR